MGEKQKLQYHPPACAALELELRENKESITVTPEVQLNTKPNEIDILVILKEPGKKLKSGLAAIFRTINLWEYKSPGDQLGKRIYYRSVGYAFLYLCYFGEGMEERDLTLSFLREGKPTRLLDWFEKNGFEITEYQPGIYHIHKTGHLEMQVVVSRELDKNEYRWITKLTDRVEAEDVKKMHEVIRLLKDERDLLNAESVYDLMCRINRDKEWMKEEKVMGELRDLFKEDFESRDRKIRELNEQLEQQNEQLEQQSEQLEQKDREIAMLREKLAALA